MDIVEKQESEGKAMNLEELIEIVLEIVVPVLELAGVFIVAEAAVASFIRYIYALIARRRIHVKGRLAAGLLLGLEFMMTAEILKTIVVRDWKDLLVLGGVVILRAVLAFELKMEEKEEREEDREEQEAHRHE